MPSRPSIVRPAALAALALVVAAAASALAGDADTASNEGFRIASVDIGRVFKEDGLADALETKLNDEKRNLQADMEEARTRVLEVRKKLERADGDERRALERDLEVETLRARLFKKDAEQTLKQRFEQFSARILADAWAESRRLAKERDYDLVIKIDSSATRSFEAAKTAAFMHVADRHDITDEVIARLNTEDRLRERRGEKAPDQEKRRGF